MKLQTNEREVSLKKQISGIYSLPIWIIFISSNKFEPELLQNTTVRKLFWRKSSKMVKVVFSTFFP